MENPFISGVPRCLELVTYQNLPVHKPGYIAKTLGISLQEKLVALELLEASNVIYKKSGKYFVSKNAVRTDTGDELNSKIGVINHWLSRAQKVLEEETCEKVSKSRPSENIWAYRTFSSSPELRLKVRELTGDYYNKLRELLKDRDDSLDDEVSVLSLNLFNPAREREI